MQRVLCVITGADMSEAKLQAVPISEAERVAALGDALRSSFRTDTAESLAADIAMLMVQLSNLPYDREAARQLPAPTTLAARVRASRSRKQRALAIIPKASWLQLVAGAARLRIARGLKSLKSWWPWRRAFAA